ncbi:MAG: aminomethyltransferase family protein [Acidimicrobiia bacterium]|nr:aminomethyltransferase family protein [Acidimicrobiia bacterium]
MVEYEWERGRHVSRFRPDGVVGTPLHASTARLSQTSLVHNWDLHHVVDVFEDFHAELKAIRTTVAMGDASPMTKVAISGADASRFIDELIPRDASGLEEGSILYSPLCNHEGKVIVDGLLFRDGKSSYRFSADPMIEWFQQHAERFDVQVRDVTYDYAILTIQGPLSREVLDSATGADWSHLGFSRLVPTTIGRVDVEVARQGFSGELGYEILIQADAAPQVWDAIADAGQPHGIRPCGHRAIDVARVEAGLVLPGVDYSNAGPDPTGSHIPSAGDPALFSSPFELGMAWLIDLEKEHFIGRDALVAERARGAPSNTLVGLEIDWRQLVGKHLEHGFPPPGTQRVDWAAKQVASNGIPAGRATSITWSPTIGKMIGFGHVDSRLGKPGTRLSVAWRIAGEEATIDVPAVVCETPFLDLRRNS